MGKKRAKIIRIQNKRTRQVTFGKRYKSVLKKAMELSILCDSQVQLTIISEKNAAYRYTSNGNHHKLMHIVDNAHTKYMQNDDYERCFEHPSASEFNEFGEHDHEQDHGPEHGNGDDITDDDAFDEHVFGDSDTEKEKKSTTGPQAPQTQRQRQRQKKAAPAKAAGTGASTTKAARGKNKAKTGTTQPRSKRIMAREASKRISHLEDDDADADADFGSDYFDGDGDEDEVTGSLGVGMDMAQQLGQIGGVSGAGVGVRVSGKGVNLVSGQVPAVAQHRKRHRVGGMEEGDGDGDGGNVYRKRGGGGGGESEGEGEDRNGNGDKRVRRGRGRDGDGDRSRPTDMDLGLGLGLEADGDEIELPIHVEGGGEGEGEGSERERQSSSTRQGQKQALKGVSTSTANANPASASSLSAIQALTSAGVGLSSRLFFGEEGDGEGRQRSGVLTPAASVSAASGSYAMSNYSTTLNPWGDPAASVGQLYGVALGDIDQLTLGSYL